LEEEGEKRINRREKRLIRENFESIFESFVGVLGVLREGFSKEIRRMNWMSEKRVT
jgi:hypothetical protein